MRPTPEGSGAATPGSQDEGRECHLAPDEAVRFIAYLLPSLVHMAETSDHPVLAYFLDRARLEAGEPMTVARETAMQ